MRFQTFRSTERWWLAVLWAVLLAAWPAAAGAQLQLRDVETANKPWNQGVPRAERVRAREIFLQGNELLRVPLFAQAAEKYRAALDIWPHPGFYYNLAIAQLNLVQPIEAYESLAEAMAYGAAPLGEERYQQAIAYRQSLRGQLGRIVIVCGEAGTQVTLNGRPVLVGPGRRELVVVPGGHQVVARREGRMTETRELTISPGQERTVELVMRLPERVETRRHVPGWIPWTTLAVGAVAVAGGGYLDWQSSGQVADFDRDFDDRCPVRGCSEGEIPILAARLDSAEAWRAMGARLYIAGGVLVVGSAVLVYVNRERIVRTGGSRDSLSVLPMLSPSGAGAFINARF